MAQPCEATKVAKMTTTFLLPSLPPRRVLLLLPLHLYVRGMVALPLCDLSGSGHDENVATARLS